MKSGSVFSFVEQLGHAGSVRYCGAGFRIWQQV